jgi:hypothetical protein
MSVSSLHDFIRRAARRTVSLALIGAVCCNASLAAKQKPLTWTLVEQALLHTDDPLLRDWSVYEAGKKSDALLVQIEKRFLLVDVHNRQIFELDPSKMDRKGGKILWSPEDRPAKPLATSGWDVTDRGGTYEIAVKLGTENAALDLQLPPNSRNIGPGPAPSGTQPMPQQTPAGSMEGPMPGPPMPGQNL